MQLLERVCSQTPGQEITAKLGEIFINDASVAMFILKFGGLTLF